ncbi:MAG: 2-C-methyl-D-erythritol 4-phosphate cytidylyltransferase [SAR202 cluster bacterium]|jgi:2-C-methyl-D-erythritol 4-phosphate cytidylyltransferase|nr:2-C-methyl-D-erythritol 4-phosphate cytidylyltransferase [SAR202 cluster bacterium]|tara:strand:- start:123 stop:755 length:633 start_codon:yes stop_codon:yes gene_type:complete
MEGVDKTFAPILGLPLVVHTMDRFELSPLVHQIVLVLSKDSIDLGKQMVQQRGYTKVTSVCAGGRRRQDSVRFGLEQLTACEWVMVHDGARPCLDDAMLQRGLEAAAESGSAVAGVPVKDTIKVVSMDQTVQETPDRSLLWAAQTPQVFRYRTLLDSHYACTQDFTDDAAMVESMGHRVKMFLGAYENIKVTTADDLIIVETFLKASSGS